LFDKMLSGRHISALIFQDHQRESKQVANTSQARKRARQAETHRRRNASQKSATRTMIKRTISAIESGDAQKAEEAYKAAVPLIDRAVTHGLFHKNKAARHKSRMAARIKALKAG